MTCKNLFVAWAFLAVLAGNHGVAQDANPNLRRYESGPLTIKDFKASATNNAYFHGAYTTVEVRYKYRCKTLNSASRSLVYITELDIFAVVVQDKSWNLRPLDVRLLDHEQGHFDVAQINAMKAMLKMKNQMNTEYRFLTAARTEKRPSRHWTTSWR